MNSLDAQLLSKILSCVPDEDKMALRLVNKAFNKSVIDDTTVLSLRSPSEGDLKSLFRTYTFPKLQEIDLSGTTVDKEFATLLRDGGYVQNLKVLKLRDGQIDAAACEVFGAEIWHSLTELDIESAYIGPYVDKDHFQGWLTNARSLKVLLAPNASLYMDDGDKDCLMETTTCIPMSNLHTVDFSECVLPGTGFFSRAAEHWGNLKSLTVRDCGMDSYHVGELCKASFRNLEHLDIRGENHIHGQDDISLEHIREAMTTRWRALKTLRVSYESNAFKILLADDDVRFPALEKIDSHIVDLDDLRALEAAARYGRLPHYRELCVHLGYAVDDQRQECESLARVLKRPWPLLTTLSISSFRPYSSVDITSSLPKLRNLKTLKIGMQLSCYSDMFSKKTKSMPSVETLDLLLQYSSKESIRRCRSDTAQSNFMMHAPRIFPNVRQIRLSGDSWTLQDYKTLAKAWSHQVFIECSVTLGMFNDDAFVC